MIFPLPFIAAVFVLIAGAIALWLARRVKTQHAPVALMVTRIGFPQNLRLHDAAAAVERLQMRDEVVIPFNRATLVIDFPLTTPAYVGITSALPIGFTRGELVELICEEYAQVYAAEEGTATNIEPRVEDRGDHRERNRTDGAYGIWGHDLDDLVLSSARWVKHSNGEVKVELHVQAKPADKPAAKPDE